MQTLKRISNTRPVTDPRIISLCTEGKSIVSPVMANVPSSSYQLPTFETTERDECNMQEIDAAVTMSISPRAITTPPPGHTGVWLGSDMRQGGRNLYMMISRNGTRITNSFDLGTKFKLYTRNGTFVQSGAWDGSLTPYGMGIVFVGINSSETSFYVTYTGDDGIPCYNRGYDQNKHYIYIPIQATETFNNWGEYVDLPVQSVMTCTCMNQRVRNKEVYAQVWGEHWSGRSRPVRTDDNGQSAFNVRAGSDVIFFVWGDDRNPNVNDQTAVSGIAPGNATFPVINNNLPTFTTNRLLGPIVQDGVTYYGVQLAWNNIGYAAHRGYLMCVRLRATQELFELNFHEGNLTSYDSGYWDIAGCDFYLMAFDTNGTVYARRLIVIP